MAENDNYKLWKGLAGALIVFCTPLGVYALLQANNMDRYLKEYEYAQADKCLNNIKMAWKITGVVYVIVILISIFAS